MRRKKKMPPELKIIRAPTSDSPLNSDKEKNSNKCGRPRSVSMFNEPTIKQRLNPASWHQFRRLPPPKCLSDIRNRNTQPSELQVKLTSLKKNVWTGIQGEEKGPLSWGISSFAMNSYFTDSEALLRSCSKKLEELEDEQKKNKTEKKKKKTKTKKISLKVPNSEDVLGPINKVAKTNKKKGKLKHSKSESVQYNSTSFNEIPRNTQPVTQKGDSKHTKSNFRKSAFVVTAVQQKKSNSKHNVITPDHSDSEDSIQTRRKKVKKKPKTTRNQLQKTVSEVKTKN